MTKIMRNFTRPIPAPKLNADYKRRAACGPVRGIPAQAPRGPVATVLNPQAPWPFPTGKGALDALQRPDLTDTIATFDLYDTLVLVYLLLDMDGYVNERDIPREVWQFSPGTTAVDRKGRAIHPFSEGADRFTLEGAIQVMSINNLEAAVAGAIGEEAAKDGYTLADLNLDSYLSAILTYIQEAIEKVGKHAKN